MRASEGSELRVGLGAPLGVRRALNVRLGDFCAVFLLPVTPVRFFMRLPIIDLSFFTSRASCGRSSGSEQGLVFISFLMVVAAPTLSLGLPANSIDDARESPVSLDAPFSEQASSEADTGLPCSISRLKTLGSPHAALGPGQQRPRGRRQRRKEGECRCDRREHVSKFSWRKERLAPTGTRSWPNPL